MFTLKKNENIEYLKNKKKQNKKKQKKKKKKKKNNKTLNWIIILCECNYDKMFCIESWPKFAKTQYSLS